MEFVNMCMEFALIIVCFEIFFCFLFIFCIQLKVFLVDYFTGLSFINIDKEVLFSNNCIEDLGCFYTGPPFHSLTNRPISLSPGKPKAKFKLFTPKNPENEYDLQITSKSLEKSSFDPELPTIFFIHGFIRLMPGTNDTYIRRDIRKALLKQKPCNVIIVDWTKDNGFPYAQAVANTRSTGALLAKLIKFLMKNAGIKPESVHLIGHSLGAHMAGYAGQIVKNIGRITALDPAGPYFHDVPKEVGLDPTDALFVDAMHTDGGTGLLSGLGGIEPVGHIDFYPNGGERQPGCFFTSSQDNIIGTVVNKSTDFVSNGCDHWRANDLFLESINDKECKFLSVLCSSYKDFEKGKCQPNSTNVAEMGFHAKPMPNLGQPAKFFLRTNDKSPYCSENSYII